MSHPYEFTWPERLGLLGALTAGAGMALPWTTAIGSRSGLAGGGWLLLLLAGVVAGSVLYREWSGPEALGAAALGLLVLGRAVTRYDDVSRMAASPAAEFVDVSVGVGLYVAALGGAALLASGAVWVWSREESPLAVTREALGGQSAPRESAADWEWNK